jgi:hypothetical protein
MWYCLCGVVVNVLSDNIVQRIGGLVLAMAAILFLWQGSLMWKEVKVTKIP